MERLRFDIADGNLRADGSERLELSLLTGGGAFSFFVFDERNRVRAMKSWDLENGDATTHFTGQADPENAFHRRRAAMARIITGQPLLGGRFDRSTCALSTPWVSLVPDKLFDEKNLPAYLDLLMDGGPERFAYFSEKLAGVPVRLVWAAEREMVIFCQNSFPAALLRHSTGGLIEAWRELASPHAPEIYANVQGKSLQLAMFDRGELQLFNTFAYQTSADFLYYVMLAFEQFRLDPERTPLFLCGELMPNSEIWRMLYRFILDIRFLPRPAKYVLPYEALDLPGHLNFDLLSI